MNKEELKKEAERNSKALYWYCVDMNNEPSEEVLNALITNFMEIAEPREKRITELEKTNEWHKQEIEDIYDLISEDWSTRYFICIMKDKRRVTATGNCDEGCNGEVSVNLVFDHDDDKYYMDDIEWWKEIVLPELPKESE